LLGFILNSGFIDGDDVFLGNDPGILIFLFIENYFLFYIIIMKLKKFHNEISGDWGLGIGDWGLGIGDWAQSPIPNPHPQ
jgi:hypothetical protein